MAPGRGRHRPLGTPAPPGLRELRAPTSAVAAFAARTVPASEHRAPSRAQARPGSASRLDDESTVRVGPGSEAIFLRPNERSLGWLERRVGSADEARGQETRHRSSDMPGRQANQKAHTHPRPGVLVAAGAAPFALGETPAAMATRRLRQAARVTSATRRAGIGGAAHLCWRSSELAALLRLSSPSVCRSTSRVRNACDNSSAAVPEHTCQGGW